VSAGDPGDQAVRAQPTQVVSDLPGGDLDGCLAEQLSKQVTQIRIAESVWEQPENQQGLEQGVGAAVPEAESGDAVPVGCDDGVVHGGEGLLGVDWVVAESLDAQQASVGGEADLPQCGQIGQSFPDSEIAGVVDGGLGAQRRSVLVILLDCAARRSVVSPIE
jgi:hypothetical protein